MFLEHPPSFVVKDALQRESPVSNPERAGQWWRMLPNNQPDTHSDPLGSLVGEPGVSIPPREAVDIGLFHFEQLAAAGLAQPTIGHYYDESEQRLYSLSHEVTGLDHVDMLYTAENQHLIPEIGRRLLAYAQWVEDTKQEFMLHDIERHSQHMFGRTALDTEARLYTIDTDIFLARPWWWLDLFRKKVNQAFFLDRLRERGLE